MCTAIKAYADECSRAGIIVKEWRSQNLCPMQCDCPSRYDACASTGQATCQTNSGRSTNNVSGKSAYNKNYENEFYNFILNRAFVEFVKLLILYSGVFPIFFASF